MSTPDRKAYEDDPDYQRWLEQCAKECTCCDRCAAGICGGVLAGRFCDGLCFCPDEYDDEDYDFDEQETGGAPEQGGDEG